MPSDPDGPPENQPVDVGEGAELPESRRGRPRRVGVDEAILDAASALIAERGYSRTSIDSVAAAAGVSKPTVYLRWASKEELVVAAINRKMSATAPEVTGDLRADLVAVLSAVREVFRQLGGMGVIGAALAEQHTTPQLLEMWRSESFARRKTEVLAILSGAADRGEIRGDIDLEAVVYQLLGAFYTRSLAGSRFPAGWEERSVDLLLDGIRPHG